MTDAQYKLLLVVVSNVVQGFDLPKEEDEEEDPQIAIELSKASLYINTLLLPSKRGKSSPFSQQKFAPWTTLLIKVFLKAISLQVSATDSKAGRVLPVALASVGGLEFVMQSFSDGSNQMEFGMQSVTVDDQRPYANLAYRRLLAPREKKKKDSVYRQLKIALVSTPQKSTLRIMVSRTRGIIFADAIVEVVSFFLIPLRAADNPFAAFSLQSKKPHQHEQPASPDPLSESTEIAPTAFELSLAISDPELFFLQDPSSLDSKALVVKSRFHIRMTTLGPKMKLMGLVKNFEVFAYSALSFNSWE